MTGHAILSPSSASRWLSCPAALWESKNIPNTSSEFAKEGTAAHALAEQCFLSGKDPCDYIGKPIMVGYEVDDDMADFVSEYVLAVRATYEQIKQLDPLTVLATEQRLDLTEVLGVSEPTFGTADSIIFGNNQLFVDDLKYGQGVTVYAENNNQLLLYAIGAYEQYSMLDDIHTITMRIFQPRKNNFCEWTITSDELMNHKLRLKEGATTALTVYQCGPQECDYQPSDYACQFCPAKGKCKALADHVLNLVVGEFANVSDQEQGIDLEEPAKQHLELLTVDDTDRIANIYSQLGVIETFCKGVRAEMHRILISGESISGFKLVAGRKGNRKWADLAEAENLMKSFRLKQEEMYTRKVISPTQTEKILKEASPKRWAKIEPLITRSDGKPTIVPESDKRPAIDVNSIVNDFEDLTNEEGKD